MILCTLHIVLTSVLGTVLYISHMPCILNLSLCETCATLFSKLSTLVMSLNSGIFCIWVTYSISAWYALKYDNLNFLFFIIHNHGVHGKTSHHPFTDKAFSPSAKCYIAWLIGASVSWRLNWNNICQLWLTFSISVSLSVSAIDVGGETFWHCICEQLLFCAAITGLLITVPIVTSSQTWLNMFYSLKERITFCCEGLLSHVSQQDTIGCGWNTNYSDEWYEQQQRNILIQVAGYI